MTSAGNNPYEVELLTTQYTTALELLLQQTMSHLRGRCKSGTHVGKMASPVQQIGVLEFKSPVGRYSPLQFQLPNYTRRWVFPNDRDLPVPVDTFDELKTIVDPKGAIAQAVTAAGNRFFDDLLIGAFFASASTGVDSSSLSTESWPTSTYVVSDTFDSAASSGMIYGKVVEAMRILRHYQALENSPMVTMACGSQQESDLKKQAVVMSKDFNDAPVVSDGKVTRIAGVDIIYSERLNTSSSSTLRNCPVWVEDGMYLGIWKDMSTRVDERKDLSSIPWQLYSMISAGATRLQLGKVIQINCADTTGADPTAP
jgi:hypothetical protein